MSDNDQGNGGSFNLLHTQFSSPVADLKPEEDLASQVIDNIEIDNRLQIIENKVEEESFVNITIEDVILVSLFKFTNPINFIEKNEHFISKPVLFNYQKYNRDVYIIFKFIPNSAQETIMINIKFYTDKSDFEREFPKLNNGDCLTENENLENNNFSNSALKSKFSEIQFNPEYNEIGNDQILMEKEKQEFPFEILLNIYKLENECFIKVKKEKITVSGPEYTYTNEDYLKMDDLIYEKLNDPLIIRIKILCQTRVPQKCDEHIGIINEGNTCYMNSVIQTLHHLPIVNKILYQEKHKDNSVISNFHKLFYNLKVEKTPIKISSFFNSLGWDKTYWNSQQDVQETFFFLFDKITDEIKKNNNNNFSSFSSLFEGKVTNSIYCEEKAIENKIEESFLFLQVDSEVIFNII
jgi:hypothetical protein